MVLAHTEWRPLPPAHLPMKADDLIRAARAMLTSAKSFGEGGRNMNTALLPRAAHDDARGGCAETALEGRQAAASS